MKRLIETEAFAAIASGNVQQEVIEIAMSDLMGKIIALPDVEDDETIFRILNYTRFRLQSLQMPTNGMGKKCGRTATRY